MKNILLYSLLLLMLSVSVLGTTETINFNCNELYQPVSINISTVSTNYIQVSYNDPSNIKKYTVINKINDTFYQASFIPDKLGNYNFSRLYTNSTDEKLSFNCTLIYPSYWDDLNIKNKTKQISYTFENMLYNPTNNTYYFPHDKDVIKVNGDSYHLQGYYLSEMFRLTKNYTYISRLREYSSRIATCRKYNIYESGYTVNGSCVAGTSDRDYSSPNSLANSPNNYRLMIGMWQYPETMKKDTMFDFTYNKSDWGIQNPVLWKTGSAINFANKLSNITLLGNDNSLYRQVFNLDSFTMYVNYSYIKDKYFNNITNETQFTLAIEYYGETINGGNALSVLYWNSTGWESPSTRYMKSSKYGYQDGTLTSDLTYYNCVLKTDGKSHICRFPINKTIFAIYGYENNVGVTEGLKIDYTNNKNISLMKIWFEPYEMLGNTNGNIDTPNFILNTSLTEIKETLDFNDNYPSTSAFRVGDNINSGHVTGARNQDEMIATMIGLHLSNDKILDQFSYLYVLFYNNSNWAYTTYGTSTSFNILKYLNFSDNPNNYEQIYLSTYMTYRDNDMGGEGTICDLNVTINNNGSVIIDMAKDATEGVYSNVLKDIKNYTVQGINNFSYTSLCGVNQSLNSSIYISMGTSNATGWGGSYTNGNLLNGEFIIKFTSNITQNYSNFQKLIDSYWTNYIATEGKLKGMFLRADDELYIDTVYRRHNYEPYSYQFNEFFASNFNYQTYEYSNFSSDWYIYQKYITQEKDFYDSYYYNGTIKEYRQIPIFELQLLYYINKIEKTSGIRFATNYSQFLDNSDVLIGTNGLSIIADTVTSLNYYNYWSLLSLLSIFPSDEAFIPYNFIQDNLTITYGRNGNYQIMNSTHIDAWTSYNYTHRWNAQMLNTENDSNRNNAYFKNINFNNRCILLNETSSNFTIYISTITNICIINDGNDVLIKYLNNDINITNHQSYWIQSYFQVNDSEYFNHSLDFNNEYIFINDNIGNYSTYLMTNSSTIIIGNKINLKNIENNQLSSATIIEPTRISDTDSSITLPAGTSLTIS